MQTVQIEIYNFDELDNKAQELAIEKNRDILTDFNWWEDTYYDAKQNGVRITGFDLDRGQSINGEFIWSEIEVADKMIMDFGECTEMYDIAKRFLRYREELCDNWEYIDGAPTNEDELEEKLNEIEYQFQQNVLNEYWKYLRDEYEYLNSDECIAEHLQANQYKFTKDGKNY